MPICFHCGELGSELKMCPTCLNNYCEFHIDPVVHECGITIESQKFQHEYNVVLHPEAVEPTNPNYTVRGSTDGYYARASPEGDAQSIKSASKSNFLTHLKDSEGILVLLTLIVLFSLFSLDLWNRQFISLNAYNISLGYYWTFFTSLFIVTMNSVEEILFFVIGLAFSFIVMRNLEKTTSIKLVYFVFGFCGLFSGVLFLIIRVIFAFYLPIEVLDLFFLTVGLGGAGLLGLTAFSVCLEPNQEWNLRTYGIPIKMKGKSLLLVIVALRLVPFIFTGFFSIFSFLLYCSELFGILAAFIYFKGWKKVTNMKYTICEIAS